MSSQISQGVLLKEIAAAAMTMAHAVDWREGIDILLGRLGRAAQVSRVYLFEIGKTDEGHLTQGCFHDWAAPGLERLATTARYQREIVEGYDPVFETWIERRRRGELIRGHTRDLTGPLREDFNYQRILTFMSMPIQVNGEWWGHLGFDDCVQEREWSAEEVHLLQTTAALIGASATRDDATQRLHRLEAMRAAMTDVALDGIIVLDAEGVTRDFNPAAEVIFRRSRSEVVGRPIADMIVPERLRMSHEVGFRAATKNRHLRSPAIRHELVAIRSDGSEFPVELALVQIKQGRDILYAGFIRDLTERQAVEERMRAAERERSNLARFFPPHLVEHMISIEQPFSVDHFQTATVLFVDMIGFTTFCSENTPRAVIDMLRELLRLLSEQVFANGGAVDKFMGDGLMAVFGSPAPGPRDATNAVRCALAMQTAIENWNAQRGAPRRSGSQLGSIQETSSSATSAVSKGWNSRCLAIPLMWQAGLKVNVAPSTPLSCLRGTFCPPFKPRMGQAQSRDTWISECRNLGVGHLRCICTDGRQQVVDRPLDRPHQQDRSQVAA